VCRVRGCGERSVRPAAQCRGAVCWLESPHMAELRANIARLIGQLVTDQPAARRGRDARKACGSNCALDPKGSQRIVDHTTRSPASRSAETNDRMRVAAGENSAESLQQFDAGTRANTGASATGPSLPVVNEWLAARSTHVRSSTKRSRMRTSHEPSPLLRLTLHWLLGVHRAPSPPPPLRVPVPALWPRALD